MYSSNSCALSAVIGGLQVERKSNSSDCTVRIMYKNNLYKRVESSKYQRSIVIIISAVIQLFYSCHIYCNKKLRSKNAPVWVMGIYTLMLLSEYA